ncbi:HEXXH motif-containing putative peptide modification protein [Streptomyces sp. VNUA116]|uniref:aKG-HExxH-type peptide beta-hydroxylase n=1 Tax=Streptomyces sp. VNUA116 TaxID=3062449 RepID=UPI00267562F4|nr:HEXXH motif-containing putative peptide modification protein [Streptomyces sp. VNUA116]WKU48797.1 HEXXH motif-containing putative peptide modification protein [Streptomyces sp. VNUA116]
MRIAPDAHQSAEERTILARMTRSGLARAGLTVTAAEAGHPAVAEIAHLAQAVLRADAPGGERLARLGRMLDRARAGIAAAPPSALPWPAEPAAPAPHLERSVVRARNSLPRQDGDTGTPLESTVVAWYEREVETLCETVALLAAVWPEAHAELGGILAQIALLDGPAIDGFTDFTVHGAVFVRRDRLGPGPDALPGPVRLAEALVHEGTHTRCNAASVAAQPFLRPARGDVGLVATPLRVDARPLTGLFQQVVVLARSVLLYRRLLDGDMRDPGTATAVRSRHAQLARSATEGVRTLADHRDALTDHGLAVLEEATTVARESDRESARESTRESAR